MDLRAASSSVVKSETSDLLTNRGFTRRKSLRTASFSSSRRTKCAPCGGKSHIRQTDVMRNFHLLLLRVKYTRQERQYIQLQLCRLQDPKKMITTMALITSDLKRRSTSHSLQRSAIPPRDSTKWFIDSGWTRHMKLDRTAFYSYTTVTSVVKMGTNDQAQVRGVGKVFLCLPSEHGIRTLRLNYLLHVSVFRWKLLSVSTISSRGHAVAFEKQSCDITFNPLWSSEVDYATSSMSFNCSPLHVDLLCPSFRPRPNRPILQAFKRGTRDWDTSVMVVFVTWSRKA